MYRRANVLASHNCVVCRAINNHVSTVSVSRSLRRWQESINAWQTPGNHLFLHCNASFGCRSKTSVV